MAEDNDDIFDAVRFDPSRSFAEVSPPERGAYTLQDGFHFGPDGRLARNWLNDNDMARLKRKAARSRADRAAEEARRKHLKAAGIDPDSDDDGGEPRRKPPQQRAGISTAEDDTGGNDDVGTAIDLVGWAKGEQSYRWFSIKRAFLAQHSREVENKEDALIWLVDNDYVEKDEVKA